VLGAVAATWHRNVAPIRDERSDRDTPKRVLLVEESEMTATEARAIDDWCFEKRIPTRAEAIRQLIVLGMKAKG
jgi:hypothetical protein